MRGTSIDAERIAGRRARQRLIEELRCSPPPSVFRIILYGLGAGAGAATFTGLLYLLFFGVMGTVLHRFWAEQVLVGYRGPLLVMFASSLFWNGLTTAILSVPYHFLCRPFPRLAGPLGATAILAAEMFAVWIAATSVLGPAPIEYSNALRVFVAVNIVPSSLIIGGVIGYAELFERRLSRPPLPAR
jgi:hypothetical protein